MSVQNRLIVSITVVFSVAFGAFLLATRGLPTSIQNEVDAELQRLAQGIVRQAELQRPFALTNLRWPDDTPLYTQAAHFFVVLDPDGAVVTASSNLPERSQPLDAASLGLEPVFTTRIVQGQSVRIMTVPIIGQFEAGAVLTGYLQIGRVVNDLAYYNRYTWTLIFIGGATLSLIMFFITKLVPATLRPLFNIIAVASQISSADDLSRRIPVSGDDELAQLARAVNQLLERLERIFRTQQQLLADVSHELRTPLTAIRGNVDLMRRLKTADPESLDAIEQEGARMARLVDDLLTLARAEVGGLPIRHDLVNLDTVFLNVYEQLSVIRTPVRVVLQEVAPVRVLGDADRLKQLMLNLMTNAVKYTNPGGMVVVGLKQVDGRAVITVRDTGIGISAEDLPRVFDRFYRVNKARSRERGGAGLGLAIAKSIALAHGGDIRVESQVGVGSVFTVELPVLDAAGLGPA